MTTPPSPDDHDAYRAFCDANGFPYVPGFVQRMPVWNSVGCLSSCCSFIFVEPDVPERDMTCPSCGDDVYVRKCPDGVRRLLTTTAMIEVECLDAEAAVASMSMVMILSPASERAARERDALEQVRAIARGRVLARHGRGPWIGDDGEPSTELPPIHA